MKTHLTPLALAALSVLASAQGGPRGGKIDVVTQNVYVGADLFRVATAEPADVPVIVAETVGTIVQTDFPSRAARLAEQIGHRRPDVIALQEVSLIRTQSPGDFLMGNPQPAEDVLFDYMALLEAALAERGLDYVVASVLENSDVELPSFAGVGPGGPLFDDVRLTDRDVILAHRSVLTGNEISGTYGATLVFDIGGAQVEFLRGYTSVEAMVRGKSYRVVNTHLEVGGTGGLELFQAGQAEELLGAFAFEPLPLLIAGDFNSDPADASPLAPTPYQQLTAAGLLDAALLSRTPGGDDATCCQAEDLSDPSAILGQRIDQVWIRPTASLGPVQVGVIGDDARDFEDGLWPSDHAGVFARVHYKGGR